jgi:hypothetical protein
VRIDLDARELSGERLDLALLRPQLELHARSVEPRRGVT